LLAEALALRAGTKVEISTPQRGEKHEIMERALTNAREQLGRRMAENSAQAQLLDGVAEVFGMDAPPRRIEVYDNSHIQGAHAIGALIVAGPEGLEKNQYRKFNIKTADLAPGDDYAMMREVLRRRFTRLLKEDAARPEMPEENDLQGRIDSETAFPDRPDIILIDGGKGQFEAARAVLNELGITGVAVTSIAKGPDRNAGRESFFIEGKEPFKLSPRDPALYFVQRLRDEAHRFAIGTHRARRKKEFTKSPLDEIPGIGPARKRALLHAFGTAKAISRAALPDFEKVPGINAAMARQVYDFFHERGR
jgi:excinuclease ABC subunit C